MRGPLPGTWPLPAVHSGFDTGGPFNTCHLAPMRATIKFSGGIHWLRRDKKGCRYRRRQDYRDWACKVGLVQATHQPSHAGLCGPELRTLSPTFPNKVIGFLSFPEAVMPAEVSKRILGKSNKY